MAPRVTNNSEKLARVIKERRTAMWLTLEEAASRAGIGVKTTRGSIAISAADHGGSLHEDGRRGNRGQGLEVLLRRELAGRIRRPAVRRF